MSELPHERLFGDYGDWPGRDVLDSGGDRLGGVREIYLDRETGRPEWVLVEVDDDQPRFVPLADASVESTAIRVAHPAAVVHAAPTIGPEAHIDNDQERRLYEHYGIAYSEDASDSGLPADVELTDAPEDLEDAPPEDTATAEFAAAGAGPTAGDDTEARWSDADAPAAETPGLPPSGPPEPPAFAGEEPATPGVPEPSAGEPADTGAGSPPTPGVPEPSEPADLAPGPPIPVPNEAGPEPPATPGAPESGAPALPEPAVPPELPEAPMPPALPEPPPAAAAPPPPPPPPPAPEGGSRRLGMAGGAAALAVLLFILVRRLRS